MKHLAIFLTCAGLTWAALSAGSAPAQSPATAPKRIPLTEKQRMHLKRADALMGEVFALYKKSKFQAAIPKAKEALAIRKTLLGYNDPRTATSLNYVGMLLHEQGKYAEARPYYEKALAIRKKILGDDNPATANTLFYLGTLLSQQGKHAAAQPYCEQALAIRKKALGDDHPKTAMCLNSLGSLLSKQGDYAGARPYYEQALAVRKKALGDNHPDTATSLSALGLLLFKQGDYAGARTYCEQALAIRKKVRGDNHPDTATSLNNLGGVFARQRDYAAARSYYEQALAINKKVLGDNHPRTATSLNNLGGLLDVQGDYAGAQPYYEQSLAIRKKVLGDNHPDTASSLNNLGGVLTEQGDYARARSYFEQSLAIRKKVLGDNHPDIAPALDNLGRLLMKQGDYAGARPYYERSLTIRKKVLGDNHPDTASSLNNLGNLLSKQGDYVGARSYFERSLAISKKVLGDNHPGAAPALSNLGSLLSKQGDYAGARTYFEQALAIHKKGLGDKHPDTATSLNNLGWLLSIQRDYVGARTYYEQALAVKKRVLGDNHPDTALSLNNLGDLLSKQGDYVGALPYYEQALAISKKVLGDNHPMTAKCLNNLGVLFTRQGDYAAARSYFEQSLAMCKKVLGENHPDTAICLNLGTLLSQQEDYAGARPYYEQALAINQRNLDLAAAGQSERQQLLMSASLRSSLDALLSLPSSQGTSESSYAQVLAWKGQVQVRQQRLRLQRANPQLAPLVKELKATSSQLALLAFASPEPKQQMAWSKQLRTLSERKEDLERQLAQKSPSFARDQQLQKLTLAQLLQRLPADTALIDFLVYQQHRPNPDKKGLLIYEQRLTAFVLRPGHDLLRVELGPMAPIDESIAQWRKRTKERKSADEKHPAQVLRRLLWQPLEKHVQGAKTVLIAPDGSLGRLPFAALPGSKPGSYLLEEVALSVVPVPRLLAELLEPDQTEAGIAPSLLLVGGVDYDAEPGKTVPEQATMTAARTGKHQAYQFLPGTGNEIVMIGAAFGKEHAKGAVTVLKQKEATVAAVRQAAAKNRYLHIATHGFFAEPQVRSALAVDAKEQQALSLAGDGFGGKGVKGFHPGLLSGLVLAGANQPRQLSHDDGILTALDVAELDLRQVDLAVLSACETGLGKVAGGEGVLGLQRAFQVAGAKSVVASLWQVNDKATQELMVRFYENLWQKKMSKQEALRQAQLAMLRGQLVSGRLIRGLGVEEESSDPRSPPYYWAAFVLSGDWR